MFRKSLIMGQDSMNHFQAYSSSVSPRYANCNTTSDWLNHMKLYGLANRKLRYIQMFLDIEKSGENTKNTLKNGW